MNSAEIATVVDVLWRVRRDCVRAAREGQLPPRAAQFALQVWPEEFAALPDGAVSATLMAEVWGNLQVLLIDVEAPHAGKGTGAAAAAWQRLRRLVLHAYMALLERPEWGALTEDLRETVLPWLADAVTRPPSGRLQRCLLAAARLRGLIAHPSGVPQAWRLKRVAEMAYPAFEEGWWGGRAGEAYTVRRAEAVIQGLVETVRAAGLGAVPLVVGFDAHPQMEMLAHRAAEIVTGYGQPVHLCRRDAPLPALSAYALEVLGSAGSAGVLYATAAPTPHDLPEAPAVETGGLRYVMPYGTPAPGVWLREISRRAALLLLDVAEWPHVEPAGVVTMIEPHGAWRQRVERLLAVPMRDARGEQSSVPEVLRRYWSRARVVIDARASGAGYAYAQELCASLQLRYALLEETGAPVASSPIEVLVSEEPAPTLGLRIDATGERLSVIDETGTTLPGDAVMLLLAEFALNERYAERPGLLLRSAEGTRRLDRLAEEGPMLERVLVPVRAGGMPEYLRAEGYTISTGDPALLHGRQVFVIPPGIALTEPLFAEAHRAFEPWQAEERGAEVAAQIHRQLGRLLLAGDAEGRFVHRGYLPMADGLVSGLQVLLACATREAPPGVLLRRMQERLGGMGIRTRTLTVPLGMGPALINAFLTRYAHLTPAQISLPEQQIGSAIVRYLGGVRDAYVECVLEDAVGQRVDFTLRTFLTTSRIQLHAEAASAEEAARIVHHVFERLEQMLEDAIRRAGGVWALLDLLAETALPPPGHRDLPGTLSTRLIAQVGARVQGLARKGREAPALWEELLTHLATRTPAHARLLAAHPPIFPLPEGTRIPPPPHVHWEGEEGTR